MAASLSKAAPLGSEDIFHFWKGEERTEVEIGVGIPCCIQHSVILIKISRHYQIVSRLPFVFKHVDIAPCSPCEGSHPSCLICCPCFSINTHAGRGRMRVLISELFIPSLFFCQTPNSYSLPSFMSRAIMCRVTLGAQNSNWRSVPLRKQLSFRFLRGIWLNFVVVKRATLSLFLNLCYLCQRHILESNMEKHLPRYEYPDDTK